MRYKVHVDETATVLHVHEGCCETHYGAIQSFTAGKRLQPFSISYCSIPIHANIHIVILAYLRVVYS